MSSRLAPSTLSSHLSQMRAQGPVLTYGRYQTAHRSGPGQQMGTSCSTTTDPISGRGTSVSHPGLAV
jgi:hypothetical protein